MMQPDEERSEIVDDVASDFIFDLPDECLACIFQSLGSGDRKRCFLVCRRWLRIKGQNRHRLSLNTQSDLSPSSAPLRPVQKCSTISLSSSPSPESTLSQRPLPNFSLLVHDSVCPG
ncbi:hypothetical protein ACFX1X_043988 [Malus domestica]